MFGASEDRARQLAAKARRKRIVSSASQKQVESALGHKQPVRLSDIRPRSIDPSVTQSCWEKAFESGQRCQSVNSGPGQLSDPISWADGTINSITSRFRADPDTSLLTAQLAASSLLATDHSPQANIHPKYGLSQQFTQTSLHQSRSCTFTPSSEYSGEHGSSAFPFGVYSDCRTLQNTTRRPETSYSQQGPPRVTNMAYGGVISRATSSGHLTQTLGSPEDLATQPSHKRGAPDGQDGDHIFSEYLDRSASKVEITPSNEDAGLGAQQEPILPLALPQVTPQDIEAFKQRMNPRLPNMPDEDIKSYIMAQRMVQHQTKLTTSGTVASQRSQQLEIRKHQENLFEDVARLENEVKADTFVDLTGIRAEQFALFQQIFHWEQQAMNICATIGPQFRRIVSAFKQYLQRIQLEADASPDAESGIGGLLDTANQKLQQFQQEILQCYLSSGAGTSTRTASNPAGPANQFFSGGGGGGVATPSSAGSKSSLNKIFDKYRDDPSTPDNVGVSGMMKYLGDINVSIEDIAMLAVSEIVKSPAMGEMTREGFVDGWLAVSCDTLDKQKAHIKNLIKGLPSSKENFIRIYKHTFQLAKVGTQKAVQLEMATEYWSLLFTSPSTAVKWSTPTAPWLEWWNEFLTTEWKRSVNKDVWNETLRFAQETLKDEELKFWSEEASWPSVIDEFVEWVKKKREGTADVMEE
ncbi:DUF298-domain-containing protein [Delitschia confertaspora ATCC 74209]|uniref:Defective in cullin neddylation protein n=1 Tax=Delitschia confertaspora ATCC 74209 TaxID=1513339 RepID=A0A9P4JGB5_9PLEO|nr:DUF298-domain-containing protein [Delitschia confertaspora ATCC 74209]